MKTRLSTLLLSLALAGGAQAGPRHWISTHKRFLAMEGAALGAGAVDYAGLNHCRKFNEVERCRSGYGAAYASWGLTVGLNTVVLPAISEGCWKDGNGKYCYIFAYTGSSAQLGFGINQWLKHSKPETEFPAAKEKHK